MPALPSEREYVTLECAHTADIEERYSRVVRQRESDIAIGQGRAVQRIGCSIRSITSQENRIAGCEVQDRHRVAMCQTGHESERIAAAAAAQGLRPGTGEQRIVTLSSKDQIRAGAADQFIAARRAAGIQSFTTSAGGVEHALVAVQE